MTYGAFTSGAFTSDGGPAFGHDRRRRRSISQGGLCASLLSLFALVGVVTVYTHRAVGPIPEQLSEAQTIAAPPLAPIDAAPAPQEGQHNVRLATRAAAAAAAAAYTGLLDPGFVGYHEATFTTTERVASTYMHLTAPRMASIDPAPMTEPLRGTVDRQVATLDTEPRAERPRIVPDVPAVVSRMPDAVSDVPEAVADVPMPMPRPTFATPVERPATARRIEPAAAISAPQAQPDKPSFFERVFGRRSPPGTALAYAAPDDGGLNGGLGSLLPGRVARDQWTAVYNISTHTVTLPDGTRLEAHSGLGARLDDPNSVGERMRGATPPNIYDLQLRETVFHGVRALRLTPVGNGETYGRGGLLAHTYMLGPRGDSNGCVVFKNYNAFLQAFESGTVRRLMVVAREG